MICSHDGKTFDKRMELSPASCNQHYTDKEIPQSKIDEGEAMKKTVGKNIPSKKIDLQSGDSG